MWKLSETLGNRTIIPADTASLNFQSTNLVEGMFGHYNYLGNLGSPRLSRLFFEREESEPTIFMAPFSSFFTRPDQVLFTNSNVPYTNLTYYKAGNKVNGEERFKSYFSVNVNKQLAFGFNIDYLYGRGYYQNQSTSHFNAGLFGSYIGEKYQVQAVYNNFFLKMNENGGIADDQYITRPENMSGGKKEYESTTIPVKLEQSSNRNKDFYIYLTQRYRLGFTRRIRSTQEGKPAVSVPKASSSPSSESEISASNNDIALPNDSIASKSVSTLAAANDSLPSVSTADNDSLFRRRVRPRHQLYPYLESRAVAAPIPFGKRARRILPGRLQALQELQQRLHHGIQCKERVRNSLAGRFQQIRQSRTYGLYLPQVQPVRPDEYGHTYRHAPHPLHRAGNLPGWRTRQARRQTAALQRKR